MTNFIKKNIFDKIRNINIFNSINSHEHHNIPEPILINSDQSDEDGDGGGVVTLEPVSSERECTSKPARMHKQKNIKTT